MEDEIPTRYCKRVKGNVYVESAEDVTGKLYVQCKFYDPNPNQCVAYPLINKKCLLQLAIQREEREKLRSKLRTN